MTSASLNALPLRLVRPAIVIRCGVDPSRARTQPLVVFAIDREAFRRALLAHFGVAS
jgi:hypothetical protein